LFYNSTFVCLRRLEIERTMDTVSTCQSILMLHKLTEGKEMPTQAWTGP